MSQMSAKSEPDLARIAHDYLRRKLEHDLEYRTECAHRPVYASWSEDRSHAEADLEWIDVELNAAKTELQNRLYDHQRPLVDELMESSGLGPEHRQAMAHAILQANVNFWEKVRERTRRLVLPAQIGRAWTEFTGLLGHAWLPSRLGRVLWEINVSRQFTPVFFGDLRLRKPVRWKIGVVIFPIPRTLPVGEVDAIETEGSFLVGVQRDNPPAHPVTRAVTASCWWELRSLRA